ncbi:hypothetical protein BJ508DRAFT_330446 [Ascobolus immersus RN42]|uniref:Uncharacterized protein n=1 Tax=Ascobolus immersus RN42 TaxID=1160509 RepID=A0A3N4HTG3_ASCIM|nr:hypothetical protein BJ508DRAFT_330446 [Ascobolus immersus RN42]
MLTPTHLLSSFTYSIIRPLYIPQYTQISSSRLPHLQPPPSAIPMSSTPPSDEPDHLRLLTNYVYWVGSDWYKEWSLEHISIREALGFIIPSWPWSDEMFGSTPPVLLQSFAEHMLFFFQHLRPFVSGVSPAPQHDRTAPGYGGPLTIGEYAFLYILRVTYNLTQRWNAKLLREGQIRIVQRALKAGLDELRIIIATTPFNTPDKEDVVAEYCFRTYMLIREFIASTEFRSERLEYFLGKYLDEEGVNMDVVNGIEEATMKGVAARADDYFKSGGYQGHILSPMEACPGRLDHILRHRVAAQELAEDSKLETQGL